LKVAQDKNIVNNKIVTNVFNIFVVLFMMLVL